MKLYTFEVAGEPHLGAEYENFLIDLSVAHATLLATVGGESRGVGSQHEPLIHSEMVEFLRMGESSMTAARAALDFVVERYAEQGREIPCEPPLAYSKDSVRILAPIPRPGKILCSGVNYHGHLKENPSATLPEFPFFFAKLPNTIIGPGDPIRYPRLTKQLDYEVELAVVIGKTLKNATEDEAMEGIAGYTILHDVSARDVQFKDQQITLGKNFDTFAPIGPCIVTPDELPHPDNLRLRTLLNGEVMQEGSTQDWVFRLPQLLSLLSGVMTLEPGDIVTTGTPAGVGTFRNPQVFMQPGDTVVLEIEGIGRLENPIETPE